MIKPKDPNQDGPDAPAHKKGSGEHPAMADAIRKIDEMRDHLLPELRAATERLGNAVDAATEPPPAETEKPTSEPEVYGLWTLGVRGRGPHSNNDRRDMERLAAAFVSDLRKAGHDVEIAQAKFDVGTVVDVSSAPSTPRPSKKGNP
jgi:hypothetical protein